MAPRTKYASVEFTNLKTLIVQFHLKRADHATPQYKKYIFFSWKELLYEIVDEY